MRPTLKSVLTSADITGIGAQATFLVFNIEVGFSRTNIDSLCGIERPIERGQRHQGFIGEKGRVIKEEREDKRMTSPSFLERADIQRRRADDHVVPGALNRMVGALIIPAEHRPRDACPVTVQPNSLNTQGDNRCYALSQRQINLSKVVTSHIILRVSASQLVNTKWR
uniref:Uncharacterized protein n=1 Tax=Fagus sylvatica TaxID=28930 RepID=A0A2N9GDV1_FAGSY